MYKKDFIRKAHVYETISTCIHMYTRLYPHIYPHKYMDVGTYIPVFVAQNKQVPIVSTGAKTTLHVAQAKALGLSRPLAVCICSHM